MPLSIQALSLFFLSAASSVITTVRADGGHAFFTYDESSAVGPSHWDKVVIENNQCGGAGINTGYGQSPVAVSDKDKCETDMSAYTFNPTTCTWDQLEFLMQKNGVKVQVLEGEDCSLGSMTVAQTPNRFNATQFHVHTSSEHTIDSKTFQAELHIVHQESNSQDPNANSFAVFGAMISGGAAEDHAAFENYLRGWEKAALAVDQACATGGVTADKETVSFTHANNAWTPVQTKVTCPAVGKSTYTEQAFDTNAEPNVYDLSSDPNFGVYTYKGGLTTPPCTEIVNWNLVDTPILISDSQMTRLYSLILCFTDPETCLPGSIASKDGRTNRPTQPLNERRIVHRCRTCDGCQIIVDGAGVIPDNATAANATGPVTPPSPPNNTPPQAADDNATTTTTTTSSDTTTNATVEENKNTTSGGKKDSDGEKKSAAAGTSFLPFSLVLMLLTFVLV